MSDAPKESAELPENAVILGQGADGEMYVLATTDRPDDDDQVIEPAKVMRIGRMISRLLDDVG